MQDQAKNADQNKGVEGGGFVALLSRLTWNILVPFFLVIVALQIATQGDGGFTWADAVFLATVALMICGRRLERRSAAALTTKGATIEHLKRYTMILMAVVAVVWLAAKLLGKRE